MSEPMDEVRANTTPGTDPRVEEMSREQTADRASEGQDLQDRRMDRAMDGAGDDTIDDRTMHGHGQGERLMGDRGMDGRGVDERDMTGDPNTYSQGGDGRMDDPVAHYRTRFAEAQARFIDDPKSALDEARSVVEEAIDKYMDSLRMDAGAGGSGDTEQMRRAMQRYRDLFDRLAGGSRA